MFSEHTHQVSCVQKKVIHWCLWLNYSVSIISLSHLSFCLYLSLNICASQVNHWMVIFACITRPFSFLISCFFNLNFISFWWKPVRRMNRAPFGMLQLFLELHCRQSQKKVQPRCSSLFSNVVFKPSVLAAPYTRLQLPAHFISDCTACTPHKSLKWLEWCPAENKNMFCLCSRWEVRALFDFPHKVMLLFTHIFSPICFFVIFCSHHLKKWLM